ncbi:MAG TPA: GIY-YIG nuclease family protein [Terracidiphilus sp.]|nr:GIY-YIG nuclease family protein [Terracidiphilus sp.]
MGKGVPVISEYAKMWPRALFYVKGSNQVGGHKRILAREIDFLKKAGVYVLYRDTAPYYVGKAEILWKRLNRWATRPTSAQYNFWNFFSVFVVEDAAQRTQLEAALIATLPGMNNGARPRLNKAPIPKEVRDLMKHSYPDANGSKN